jgi:hypothetical protein
MIDVPPDLPGHDLVSAGLADLAAGRETEAALLVAMAAPRLRSLGFDVPAGGGEQPSHRLMRPPVDAARIREVARRLGRVARAPVRIYVTGGATAVLEGWRESTIEVDLRFEPEADELLRELSTLKERLGVNIEFASPPDFIPELPGWRERSPFVFREGNVEVHHFDPSERTTLYTIRRRHDLPEIVIA